MAFLPFSDEQLQDLEQRFGRLGVVRGKAPPAQSWSKLVPEPPWECVFRAPNEGESNTFEGAANREDLKAGATRNLAKATVVAVSLDGEHVIHDGGEKAKRAVRDAWDRLRAHYPMAHTAADPELRRLLGMERDDTEKE